MSTLVNRLDLLNALSLASRVSPKSTPIPILTNACLYSTGERLLVEATDLDQVIRVGVPLVKGNGALHTVAPAHQLKDIAKKAVADTIALDVKGDDGEFLSLGLGMSSASLPAQSPRDWPTFRQCDGAETRFLVSASTLRNALDKVRGAVANEEFRYYLNGVYLHVRGKMLRFVATNGHRLSLYEMPAPEGVGEDMPGVIIPAETVGTLLAMLGKRPAGNVAVTVQKTVVAFTYGDANLWSKAIDGTFPDYGRVIPLGNEKTLKVDRVAFTAALEQATATVEKGRAVKIALDVRSRHVVKLTSRDTETGASEAELCDAFAAYDSDPLDIGFNSRYLRSLIGTIDDDKIEFKLADAGSPALIRGAHDRALLHVLMSMRV